MKLLMISVNTERINMPVMPLGMACVGSAAQQAGHLVRSVNLMETVNIEAKMSGTIRDFVPEVIGISVRNIDDQSMKEPRFLLDLVKPVVDICRKLSDAPVVLGGAGFSIFPQAVLDYLGADMGVQGEGEGIFTAMLSYLERGETVPDMPGLFFSDGRRTGLPVVHKTLDDYPMPVSGSAFSKNSGADLKQFWLPVQTRRGCAMGCSYCSTPSIEGRRLRKRSPGAVVEMLRRYVDAGITQFYFVDNTFNLPPSYAKALCDAIIDDGIQIRWQAIVYPNFVDKELAMKMARAGCAQVSIGFESGDENVLAQMEKHTDPGTIVRITEVFKAHGIRRMGFLLLGGPGESRASVERSFDFVDRLDLEMMRLTVGIRIYPQTALSRLAVREGLISSGDSLLHPRFYLQRELASWLPDTAVRIAAEHSSWIM